MKLGEIKAQAIALMYPNANVKLDETDGKSINEAIFELKADPNFEGILENTVGSINRCFSRIESLNGSHTRCCDVPITLCVRLGDRIFIGLPEEALRVDRVLAHRDGKTYVCGYEMMDTLVSTDFVADVYTVVYKSKILRITSSTSEDYALDLPHGIAELIPFYIKGELYMQEDREEARESMELFNKGVSLIASREVPCSDCFQMIYAPED